MKLGTLPLLFLAASALPCTTRAQQPCPVSFLHFSPDLASVRVENTSGKTIVGLSFYAALADATEHWKWFHWDYDDSRPLREFGWNKEIKPGQKKTLSWSADLEHEHGAGGAFILTSILFSDGSSWEETSTGTSCHALWFDPHKKFFARPITLPPRTPGTS